MAAKPLDILVLLREVTDPRPPAQLAEEGALVRDRGLRRLVNPADLEALEEALLLADDGGARVTALAVGPGRLDDTLRVALGMGVQRAIRVWDRALEGADAVATGELLTRCLSILRPGALFTGSRLLDAGAAPAPALAAAALGVPSCDAVVALRQVGEQALEATRKGDRGSRQRIELPMPCAVLFEGGAREPRYPDMEGVLAALEGEVELWGLPELGLSARALGEDISPLRPAGYSFPRPTPVRVTTPDANLPAHERIRALLSGGIQAREGRMHFGSAETLAEGLFQVLCREGLVPGAES
ncbi:MAG: hypothetical protein P1P84_15970 [Deferrisomatales bacterium]|nr:hypothetical protein [Deferrisomatales bacterium]